MTRFDDKREIKELRQLLATTRASWVLKIAPKAKEKKDGWHLSDISGAAGDSLLIYRDPNHRTHIDFNGEGWKGDDLDLIGKLTGISNFSDLKRYAAELVGYALDRKGNGAAENQAKTAADQRRQWAVIMPVPADTPQPPKPRAKPGETVEARHCYRDPAGAVLMFIDRFRGPDGGHKRFQPQTLRQPPAPCGRAQWIPYAPPDPQPLYGLDRLNGATRILLVEGERKSDVAQAMALPEGTAVLSIGATGKVERVDFSPVAGLPITGWPDHDGGGRKAMIAALLRCEGAGAVEPRLVTVPESFPDKWDLADPWPEPDADPDVRVREMIAAAIPVREAVAADAAGADRSDGADKSGREHSEQSAETDFAEFADILGNEMTVPLFPTELLPHPFNAFVQDIANRMQVPPDFVAIPLLVEAATMLGRAFSLQPKRNDIKWRERACLWGMVIAPSGSLKTPAMLAPLEKIHDMQRQYWREYAEAMAGWERLSKQEKKTQAKPVGGHILVSDATVEGLAALMNPANNTDMRGILFYRDELAGWYLGMNQYKKNGGSDRQFFLECYNGGLHGKYRAAQDRTVFVDDAYISICGGLQPGVLTETFRNGEIDGLLARFQLAAFPQYKSSKVVDQQPNQAVADVVSSHLLEMHDLRMLDDSRARNVLRFDKAAYSFFMAWINQHQSRADVKESTPIGAHLAKYPGTVVRLALVLHFLRHGKRAPTEVGLETVEAVCKIVNLYLEPHARRIYDELEADPSRPGAVRIAKWIRTTRPTAPIRARDIRRNKWREFTRHDDPNKLRVAIISALDLLEAYGWVRAVMTAPDGSGGRPTRSYIVNPLALSKAQP
jgi:putative DNA primase/helicase